MVARWPGSAPRSLVMHADPLSAYAYRWFGRVASIATIDRHPQKGALIRLWDAASGDPIAGMTASTRFDLFRLAFSPDGGTLYAASMDQKVHIFDVAARAEIGLLREATPQGLPRDAEAMANLVKNAPLTIMGVSGIERAISTAGGVCFEACDDRLMLRQLPGVFVAGEMLDFDAPTGGYLLQAAFATGRAAGLGAAEYLGLSGVKEAFADTDHAGFAPRHLPNSLELAASNK